MVKKVVVDSSVAIKWFVPQPHSIKALEILNQYRDGSLSLLAPDLIYAEVGNIIWKLHKFQNVSEPDAQAILKAFRLVTFVITPSASLLDNAYQLAVTHQRTVYDALYIALSLRHQCQFVTAEEKLVNAVSGKLLDVILITNWS